MKTNVSTGNETHLEEGLVGDEVGSLFELCGLRCVQTAVVQLSVDDQQVCHLVGDDGRVPDAVLVDERQLAETLAVI